MNDPFNLERFVDAQTGVYEDALPELRAGDKRGHWMWYIFPQLEGLGSSVMSQRYSLSGVDEARAYLDHPVLGPRLRTCVEAVLGVEGRSAHAIFGSPDDMKFRSCLTLFNIAAPDEPRFTAALNRYFGGESDPATLARLA